MRKATLNIVDIKAQIEKLKGKSIAMQVNLGRKKTQNYLGMVQSVYPSVFTVKIRDNTLIQMATYSYSDVLCGDVKIKETGGDTAG